MKTEEAIHFMIFTRYGQFPKKRDEFIPLYAMFLSSLENPETDANDFPYAFSFLNLILDSFHLHHEIPENIEKSKKEELEMLRRVISLMHIYEAGAIFKSPPPPGFPTVRFLDNFIYNIDQEYYKKSKILKSM